MAQKNRKRTDDAVSPVIGVILMVAITVILAAVIGTFVLGLGGQVQQNAQAGVSFNQNNDSSVTVTLNSIQRADAIYIQAPNGSVPGNWTSVSQSDVGTSKTVTSLGSGDRITVVGEYQGSRNTITSYTVK
ncbi:MAG: type IV pilin N-terminal domain-containing protein [Halobacteria archaeon]|nr:type IV pilin N-terminal domain-containing protein [Halobacteria archaeon]